MNANAALSRDLFQRFWYNWVDYVRSVSQFSSCAVDEHLAFLSLSLRAQGYYGPDVVKTGLLTHLTLVALVVSKIRVHSQTHNRKYLSPVCKVYGYS